MNKSVKTKPQRRTISVIENDIVGLLKQLGKQRKTQCYSLLLANANIGPSLVDTVYDDLRENYEDCKSLDVIVESGGGNIDAAYNISLLLRRYCKERLTFIVPRWAKSAATLLVCAGDEILMTPVAELGPLDPQITEMNPIEQRIEQFSPLHIQSTLELIREEFEKGNKDLAEGLMQRLQFPLTLGSFKKSLDIAKEYLEKLLSTRMLALAIAKRLSSGYADHSWCITSEEACDLGLNVQEIKKPELDIVWGIHKLTREGEKIRLKQKREKIKDQLKDLPPGLIDQLPPELLGGTPQQPAQKR